MAAQESNRLRIGLLGAGSVAQVIHLPVLALMSHLFTPTIICDISSTAAAHCADKFHIPSHTTNAADVWLSPDVDVVFVLTSDEYHEQYCIAALQAGKHVFVEKPLTLSLPSVQRIAAAEQNAGGSKVFVGYMRRYAASFTQAFAREVASIDRILYARVRDFSGPNDNFVGQSGTFFKPPPASDFTPAAGEEIARLAEELVNEAWAGRGGNGQQVTKAQTDLIRFLGRLGSHDISLMREILGSPASIGGVSANEPFYSALLHYETQPGTGKKEPFAVTYESGIDGVPVFDAHFAVYGQNKRVSIEYPSPFVKGLPIKVKVDELNAAGETQSREMLSSYEDAYTSELKELWSWVVEGKAIKTSTADAAEDLGIYDMLYQKYHDDSK